MMIQSSELIHYITIAKHKVAFNELKKKFGCNDPLKVKELKLLLKKLMRDGILLYSSHYGRSNIEISYDKPTMVSQHIVLKSAVSNYNSEIYNVISLDKGASFGNGDHPTTRLCIKLIDNYFYSTVFDESFLKEKKNKDDKVENVFKGKEIKCLDIGTGSGVLAIIAAKLGAKSVLAVDNDPCSLYEAKKNININNLSNTIVVKDICISKIVGPYDLILANLRLPTLLKIGLNLQNKLSNTCDIILSGIKENEDLFVIDQYAKSGFLLIEKITENGWKALWLHRA